MDVLYFANAMRFYDVIIFTLVCADMRKIFKLYLFRIGGTRWRSWLRHCATSRKVAGSIPDGVTGIFLLT